MAAGFDIHVDAISLSEEAEHFLVNILGFWRSDFCGHPEGYPSYEPPHHLTLQPTTAREYKTVFQRLRDFFSENPGAVRGYIEGEHFAFDEDVPSHPFDPNVFAPFTITTGFLAPGKFRESEIHVTMSREHSDRRVIKILMDMGLFTAYLMKDYGVGQVFTVGGTKVQIAEILPVLFDFLKRIGGASNCSVKEERVAGWWLSERSLSLPPVAKRINWSSAA